MERQKITRSLVTLYAIFAAVLVIGSGAAYAAIATGGQEITEAIQEAQAPDKPAPVERDKPEARPIDTTTQEAPVERLQEQPVHHGTATVPTISEQPQQPERIPFTQKDVTPGQPDSYVDTYGQCPFYENAGAKGCYPPPGITCNADWSHCTMSEATPTSIEEDHTDGSE